MENIRKLGNFLYQTTACSQVLICRLAIDIDKGCFGEIRGDLLVAIISLKESNRRSILRRNNEHRFQTKQILILVHNTINRNQSRARPSVRLNDYRQVGVRNRIDLIGGKYQCTSNMILLITINCNSHWMPALRLDRLSTRLQKT